MTHEEDKALAAVLSLQCSGVTQPLRYPLRTFLLRWCLCELHDAIGESAITT